MRWKKYIAGILLLLFFYAAAYLFQLRPQQQTPQVEVAQTQVTLYEQPESGRQPLIAILNNAKKYIYVQSYLISDTEILNSLISAHKRGVKVLVMMEEHPFGGGSVNPKSKKLLESTEIPVMWANPKFALTHQKSIIIDGTTLLVLNQNLTKSAFDKNREYDIVDKNPQDVKLAENIFTADWQRRDFVPLNSNLLISPVNARDGLNALINQAKKEITIEIEVITDDQIEELLRQKDKTTRVRILSPPASQIASNQEALLKLQDNGVEVRTLSSPYLHAKLIIVDENTAYVGSINLSSQSMDKNREMGIVLSEAALVKKLDGYFEKDWAKGKDL